MDARHVRQASSRIKLGKSNARIAVRAKSNLQLAVTLALLAMPEVSAAQDRQNAHYVTQVVLLLFQQRQRAMCARRTPTLICRVVTCALRVTTHALLALLWRAAVIVLQANV